MTGVVVIGRDDPGLRRFIVAALLHSGRPLPVSEIHRRVAGLLTVLPSGEDRLQPALGGLVADQWCELLETPVWHPLPAGSRPGRARLARPASGGTRGRAMTGHTRSLWFSAGCGAVVTVAGAREGGS